MLSVGVLMHLPDFLMFSERFGGMKMTPALGTMPITGMMIFGMVAIGAGLALAAWGLLPQRAERARVQAARGRFSLRTLDDAPMTGAQWRTATVLVVALIVDVMKPATLGFIIPGLRAEYGLTTAQVALLPVVALTGTTIGSILWGVLADRVGRRAAILLASLMFIGTAICGVMPVFELNLLMCFIMGLSAGGMLPIEFALFSETMPRRKRGFLLVLTAGLGTAGGYLAASHGAFLWGRYWMEVVPVPLALFITYAGTVAKNFAQEQREKRRLSRFFSPDVVAEIVRHKDDAKLAANRRRMTVLFSDIRGFTSMSEKMQPEEVVTFLREYLTVMTEAVFKHGGTVDKYIGDAIMALYNVPFEAPDHALRAVRTALEFQERLQPLAERFAAKHGGLLACGVGIHTGDAVVGTIGSEQRLEYTAIGDTINLGSRLEGLTKEFSVPIIISEATYAEVRDHFGARDLGEVTVKGKAIPVKIYAVLGELRPHGRAVDAGTGAASFNSRSAPRLTMKGRVSISDGELTVVAEASDLSRTGLAVHAVPRRLEPGEMVSLQIALRDHPEALTIERAEVMWARKDTAGLRFVELSPAARAALDSLTAQS